MKTTLPADPAAPSVSGRTSFSSLIRRRMKGESMKKEVDYEAATEYDWTLFTIEDEKAYRKILISMPYDPKLAQFFHEQKQMQRKENSQRDRYLINRNADAVSRKRMEQMALNLYLEEEQQKEETDSVMREMEWLDSADKRRLEAYYYEQKTFREIAEQEGVSKATVYRSIHLAIGRIREEIMRSDMQ